MPELTLLERLLAHRLVGSAPREELLWVTAHGRLRRLERGDLLSSRAAGSVDGLFVLLSGHIAVFVDRANGRERLMDWHGGDVTGMLPYSRLGAPPGDVIAVEPTELLMIPRDEVPTLARECPVLTGTLVHVMLDRARHFTSSDLHQEKMASLGKLSAGLAHELNNPAAAIARSARALRDGVIAGEDAARAIGALSLRDEQVRAIERLRHDCLDSAHESIRTPLQQADREAEIEDWLSAHECDVSAAASLADTTVTVPMLDELAASLTGAALDTVLHWVAATCTVRHLADEIEQAAGRISGLVDAVKGFTHMDQNATAGPVDIRDGLMQTLAIVKAKARGKSASVTIAVPPELPAAQGVAGELNQVWVNLIDNALDAIAQSGAVAITATVEDERIVVRVVDDGPGIPPDVRRRIFDPFFTTKNIGQGTGLGLDTVNRIVRKHGGRIEVQSAPGRTEFAVSLPLASTSPAVTQR